MNEFLNLTLSGAITGSIYSLIATSLVLTYRTTGVFNLANGAIAFVAAFLYFELHTGLGWGIVPSLVGAVVVLPLVVGLLLDKLIFSRLHEASEAAKLTTTVGLLVALPAIARFVVDFLINTVHLDIPTGENVFAPPGIGPTPATDWRLSDDIIIDSNQLIVLIVAAVLGLGLWILLHHTRVGLMLRATVDRPALAGYRGISAKMTSSVAWILGVALACVAGVVGAPVLTSLDPTTYTIALFTSCCAAVVGGLRSIPLAFLGGILLGIAQNMVASYISLSDSIHGLNSAVPFILLFVGLIVLARNRMRTAGTSAEDRSILEQHPRRLLDALPWLVAVCALTVYVYWIADGFWLNIVLRGLVLGLIFQSIVILTGYGGLVSLAQAALVSAAGLAMGVLYNRYHLPLGAALLTAVLLAVAFGVVVALPSLRLGGLAFGLATLALALLCDRVLFVWRFLSNGDSGWSVPRPEIGPVDLADDRIMAIAVAILICIVVAMMSNFHRSLSGRATVAVRSAAPAAAAVGISATAVKLRLFIFASAIAGLGGCLFAMYNGTVTSRTAPALVGVTWFATVVLLGVRRPGGAVVAGIFAAAFPQILSGGVHWPSFVPSFLDWNGTSSPYIASILFGVGAIQLARSPDGVMPKLPAFLGGRGKSAPSIEPSLVDEPEFAPVQSVEFVRSTQLGGAVLSIEGVHVGYGEVEVLHGVTIPIEAGTITALVGVNGGGKSTLRDVIGGALVPWSGRVVFNGRDLRGESPHRRRFREGLAVVPESRGVFPGLTVDEQLKFQLPDRADRDAMYARFSMLGERQSELAGSLSGGEQQILSIAPFLVKRPVVLVADEPTLGVAPIFAAEITRLLTEIAGSGTAVFVVEERVNAVVSAARSVQVMSLGHIVWQGSGAEVDPSMLTASYFGTVEHAAESMESVR